MSDMKQAGELCAAEDPRDGHGDKLQPLAHYLPYTLLNRLQHPHMVLNKSGGQSVRDGGTETVPPKPRVPPRSCISHSDALGCPSTRRLLRFRAAPSPDLRSSACSESAAAFSKHRFFLQLIPSPSQSRFPRRRRAQPSTQRSASTRASTTQA